MVGRLKIALINVFLVVIGISSKEEEILILENRYY